MEKLVKVDEDSNVHELFNEYYVDINGENHEDKIPIDHPDNSISSSKLMDNSVSTEKIVNFAVTTNKITDLAINSQKISDLTITTEKIRNSAITTEKINDEAVTTSKIANLNITTEKLADDVITTTKLLNNSVTTEKLSQDIVDTILTIESVMGNHTHTENDIIDIDKYSKDEVDEFLNYKSQIGHTHTENEITDIDKYTKNEINVFLSNKSQVDHTHIENDIIDLNITTDKLANRSVTEAKLSQDILDKINNPTSGNTNIESEKGIANGIATLDENTKIPIVQLPNIALTAETGTETDITTPAISSNTITSVLQSIWNKIRQLGNAKQNNIAAGTSGRLLTSSGTVGTVNEVSSTVGSTQLPVYINAGVPTANTQANLRIGIFGSSAVGSASQPVYIAANGVPTAATSPVLPSGGTMTGTLTAGGTLAVGTAQVRNIQASTTDLTAGTSSLATGQIYLVYE